MLSTCGVVILLMVSIALISSRTNEKQFLKCPRDSKDQEKFF